MVQRSLSLETPKKKTRGISVFNTITYQTSWTQLSVQLRKLISPQFHEHDQGLLSYDFQSLEVPARRSPMLPSQHWLSPLVQAVVVAAVAAEELLAVGRIDHMDRTAQLVHIDHHTDHKDYCIDHIVLVEYLLVVVAAAVGLMVAAVANLDESPVQVTLEAVELVVASLVVAWVEHREAAFPSEAAVAKVVSVAEEA